MSHVACQLSPVANANSHNTRPSPYLNFPIIHSRLVHSRLVLSRLVKKIIETERTKKMCDRRPILAIRTSTRSLQATGKWVFCDGAHRQTHRRILQLVDWIGLRADSVKRSHEGNPPPCQKYDSTLLACEKVFAMKSITKKTVRFLYNYRWW